MNANPGPNFSGPIFPHGSHDKAQPPLQSLQGTIVGVRSGRRGEAEHARRHGGAEDVGGVVGSEREAEEEAAREEDQDGELHPGSPRDSRARRRAYSDRLMA